MFYNHVIKTYPDGTVQHLVSSVARQKDFDRTDKDSPKHDGSSVERKEFDNMKRAKQKVFDYARSNKFDWFVTLTLSKENCDRYDYDSCRNELKKFTKWLTENNFQYLIVPEQHKDKAYHFHGLIQGDLPVTQAVEADGTIIHGVYWVDSYSSGYTTATKIKYPDRVATYITKYLTKDMNVPKGRKRYWNSNGLLKPVVETDDNFVDNTKLFWYQTQADFTKVIDTPYGTYSLFEFHADKEVIE